MSANLADHASIKNLLFSIKNVISDVRIICSDGELPAIRNIISARNKCFKEILDKKQNNIINFPTISVKTMGAIINFLQFCDITLVGDINDVFILAGIAHEFEVNDLVKCVVDYLFVMAKIPAHALQIYERCGELDVFKNLKEYSLKTIVDCVPGYCGLSLKCDVCSVETMHFRSHNEPKLIALVGTECHKLCTGHLRDTHNYINVNGISDEELGKVFRKCLEMNQIKK